MGLQAVSTCFASPERDSAPDVLRQHRSLCGHFIAQTLDALPLTVVVLNRHRQIVLANAQTLSSTRSRMDDLLGKRPGEAFGCVHSGLCTGGCGTSEFCSRCGAVLSILMGIEGRASIKEYSLLRLDGKNLEALDLLVSSSPVEIDGVSYVLFSIQDQSDLMRRRTLERIFFHDMLNTAGGLRGLMDILRSQVPDGLKPDAEFIHLSLTQMVEELQSQKDLVAAENNELTPVFIAMDSLDALGVAARMGASLGQSWGQSVCVLPESVDLAFLSDYNLVKRVLGNMVKNALEASRSGESVTLSCAHEGERVVFRVHNPAVMHDDVRLRVFQRNFSTKGLGRGLGTYGMKLLAERYLGGRVDFTSREPEGTVFSLSLPLVPDRKTSAGDEDGS